jgi:hypothetical protein
LLSGAANGASGRGQHHEPSPEPRGERHSSVSSWRSRASHGRGLRRARHLEGRCALAAEDKHDHPLHAGPSSTRRCARPAREVIPAPHPAFKLVPSRPAEGSISRRPASRAGCRPGSLVRHARQTTWGSPHPPGETPGAGIAEMLRVGRKSCAGRQRAASCFVSAAAHFRPAAPRFFHLLGRKRRGTQALARPPAACCPIPR